MGKDSGQPRKKEGSVIAPSRELRYAMSTSSSNACTAGVKFAREASKLPECRFNHTVLIAS
eukprot:5611604-Karenia_brevis.AAC.1